MSTSSYNFTVQTHKCASTEFVQYFYVILQSKLTSVQVRSLANISPCDYAVQTGSCEYKQLHELAKIVLKFQETNVPRC